MKSTNLTVKDLLADDAKLTFLVGSGSSIERPSNLPDGWTIMKIIINHVCHESEKERILELVESGKLRFEQLIQIFQDAFDKDLKIINYYGLCDKPNIQHFFLAEMIIKGQFVMTTNFDFLIELALRQSNVPDDEIIPVITKEDFNNFGNPDELFRRGKKILYKIHGSTKNIINPEDTRSSLISTIRALVSNKEGLNTFQLEPFKQPVFEHITKNRDLVIMGYSGSDDFDIGPTLKALKNLRRIIWIFHTNEITMDEVRVFKINAATPRLFDTLDEKRRKVTEFLFEIWQQNNVVDIYRIDVNTTSMIKDLIDSEPEVSSDEFNQSLEQWLEDTFEEPTQTTLYAIPFKIYHDFNLYNDALRCSEKILHIVEKDGERTGKSLVLNNIGHIYLAQGKYPEALKRYEEALGIAEQLGDLSIKGGLLNNIGEIYYVQGKYPEALKRYEKALGIAEQLGGLAIKSTVLNNIGLIYYAQEKYPEALKRCEEALGITEQLGDLLEKATCLNNIGLIYHAQGKYPEALKRYEEALGIAEQLGDLSGKVTCFNNIGQIYYVQGKYPEALKRYEEALGIAEQLGDFLRKAATLNNIGEIYHAQEKYPEALKRYEEALGIAEHLGDLSGKATRLSNIASIYEAQGNYLKAIKKFEQALEILITLGLSESISYKSIKENIEYLSSKI